MSTRSLAACLSTFLSFFGCGRHTEESLPSSFSPPSLKSLANADVSDATYGNESVVIEGVVAPNNQGGWPGKSSDYKIHCFTFSAWLRLDNRISQRELTILRPVPPDTDYWEDFPKYSIHRIRVLLSSDETRAIFEEALPVDAPDQALQKIAAELQMPVIFTTERFGDLVLDRSIDWFEAETKWYGETIRVTFPVNDDSPNKDALKTAETLWSDEAKWKECIEQYAVKELLDLKNDIWLGDDESEFTAAQFIATMKLTSISIESEGEFEFWFDDGDLFWGHSIMVRGNLKDGPTDAGIHG